MEDTLVVKLGTLVRLVEELAEVGVHAFDLVTVRALIRDGEVQAFVKSIDPALLP